MHILITRPDKQAKQLADILKSSVPGNTILIEPLLSIHPYKKQKAALHSALAGNPQAIIITSSNAIKALADMTERRDIPILAVGEASSGTACRYGFKATACGEGVKQLVHYILEHANPHHGGILYASGMDISWDFIPLLSSKGFNATRIILYDTIAASHFTPFTTEVFIARSPVAAVFYSAQTASIFNKLAQHTPIEETLRRCVAFALSDTIAETLSLLGWGKILTAEQPTQAAMVALLTAYIKEYNGKY